MNDLNFSGKWFNPRTGQEINVRSNVIDGDNMIIVTDKGNLTMDEFSEFIQMGDEEIPNSQPQGMNTQMSAEVMKELESAKIKEEDYMLDVIPINNPNNINNIKKQDKQNKQVDIIDKFFSKIDSKPTINITLNWDSFPWDQLNTLIQFLDIKSEDISNYILDHYLNNESIKNAINKILSKNIIGEQNES